MVTIRLSRFGRKKAPFYRVVAVDASKKRDGMVLEVLGFWNPIKKELEIKKEELKNWVNKGAQLSATVKKLIEK
ncbi:MAG TPA: 30S ribosomal protein S16 [Alphaproteobacteria bacterium]|jgi:small subunit ribosomal protein S16|nr:30S ribosomal protein S16 [Alphaproteobacteria bacterium]